MVRRRPNFGESFLGERQLVTADTVSALQQATREQRSAIVRRITGCDLLGFRQEHFAVTREKVTYTLIAINKL